MSDQKIGISQLPSASLPLADSIIVNQSGSTKKIQVVDLMTGRNISEVSAETLKTSSATAAIWISGRTLTATGSDANIDIALIPKGTGKVGIGVSNPLYPLHMVSSSGASQIYMQSPSGSIAQIQLVTVGVGTQSIAANVGSVQNLVTYIGGNEAMRIDANRRIGFGTSAVGDYGANTNVIDLYGSTGSVFRARSSVIDFTCRVQDGNAAAYMLTSTNHPIKFGTNGSERMSITGSGDVGIGTSSPSNKLHVVGSINANGVVA